MTQQECADIHSSFPDFKAVLIGRGPQRLVGIVVQGLPALLWEVAVPSEGSDGVNGFSPVISFAS